MKNLLGIFLSLVFLFSSYLSTYAASNFSVASNVTYTISENGMTHADFKVNLTNTTSQYYASSYKINVGFEEIKNVKASDSGGSITPKIQPSENGTSIELVFNNSTVGKDKVTSFTLSFDTPNIVQNQGKIWELNIPSISNKEDFTQFNVVVTVPESFGEPTYIKPAFESVKKGNSLHFTKDQLKDSHISLAFGTKQVYEFTLSYHLKNSNFFPIKTEIALPPSTNYQDVYFDSIDPKPMQVTQDKDGNWLAQYSLSPREKKTVVVKGLAEIALFPRQEPATDAELAPYLEEQKYWDTSSQEIQQLAKDLKTPEAIYNYVVKKLTYDFSRVSSNKPRVGAKGVLENPSSAVCLEFNDLFVAIARAANIPARSVEGFAYTQNSLQRPLSKVKDILHVWPQYYDKELETWVMVDPTWGNTSRVDYFNILDFDHFAFVIKGHNSEYPIPAGGYKTPSEESVKDVQVTFTHKDPVAIFDSKAEIDFPSVVTAGLPIGGNVLLWNSGNTILPSQEIVIESSFLEPKKQIITSVEIPPFGYAQLPVTYRRTAFLTNTFDTLTIRVGNKKTTHQIAVVPFALTPITFYFIGGILGALFITGLCIFATRTRRI